MSFYKNYLFMFEATRFPQCVHEVRNYLSVGILQSYPG